MWPLQRCEEIRKMTKQLTLYDGKIKHPWPPPVRWDLAVSALWMPFLVRLESITKACIAGSIWFQKRGPERLSGGWNGIWLDQIQKLHRRNWSRNWKPTSSRSISAEGTKHLSQRKAWPDNTESPDSDPGRVGFSFSALFQPMRKFNFSPVFFFY